MIVPYFLVFFFYLTPSPVKFYAIIDNRISVLVSRYICESRKRVRCFCPLLENHFLLPLPPIRMQLLEIHFYCLLH